MSILGRFALLPVLGARVLVAQNAAVTPNVQRQVAAVLDSAVAVGRRGDSASFRRFVSPDFRFIHSTGRVNLTPDFLEFLSTIRPDSTRELAPTSYIQLGDAVVVLKHEATLVPQRGWAEFRSSDLVVHYAPDGKWRWALHQSTALPIAPGAWIAVPDSLLAAYAGEYRNAQGMVRNVVRVDDHLTITAVGGNQLPYRALTPTTFHVERGDAYAVFVRNGRGEIAYLEILQPTGVDRLTKKPQP